MHAQCSHAANTEQQHVAEAFAGSLYAVKPARSAASPASHRIAANPALFSHIAANPAQTCCSLKLKIGAVHPAGKLRAVAPASLAVAPARIIASMTPIVHQLQDQELTFMAERALKLEPLGIPQRSIKQARVDSLLVQPGNRKMKTVLGMADLTYSDFNDEPTMFLNAPWNKSSSCPPSG